MASVDSIGATLARAREAAGLSVAEVSARTRIRTPLIRAIEADDFGPCGGDFYARGHIRAIARIVDVDSRPLIDAYDGLAPGQRSAEPAGIEDLLLPAPPETPDPGSPAPATGPGTAPQPVAQTPRDASGRSRPRDALIPLVALALTALTVIATGAYRLVSAGSPRAARGAASGPTAPAQSKTPVRQSASASPPASPSASPKPSPKPTKVATTQVTPSSASADDDPADASKALGGDSGDPWHTHWYTSATFGNLKSGTGLTLTLPQTVTATGVTVKFADSGGSMQVKAGTSPDSLHTVASGSAGGTQTLSFPKTSARYVELWFTRLGTSDSGSNQVAVYDVSVSAQKSS